MDARTNGRSRVIPPRDRAADLRTRREAMPGASGESFTIYGIDPGLANTAVVAVSAIGIEYAATIKTDANGRRPTVDEVMGRSRAIASALFDLAEHLGLGSGDVVAVEAYRDIPGPLRGATMRWTTPMCMGVCMNAYEAFGPVTWQDPEHVMRMYADTVGRWSAGHSLVTGDELLTNSHLRSAAAHALYARARLVRGAL